jgi:hypothetical protein
VEPGEAHLVVRAPLYLFKSTRFPVANIEIDVPQTGAAIARTRRDPERCRHLDDGRF